MRRRQPILHELLRKEEPPRDVQLLIVRVARELDHFTSIEERRQDGVERVGRTNEKNLGKIDRDVNVVILSINRIVSRSSTSGYQRTYVKSNILLRVEHFEQRRRRVTMIV